MKDLHTDPFDDGTITKLEIFENYTKEWLPTFIMSENFSELYIFDFFAGPGYDNRGVAGSSIRILRQVKDQAKNIFQKMKKINICLNELNKEKFEKLKNACEDFIDNNKELKQMKKNI